MKTQPPENKNWAIHNNMSRMEKIPCGDSEYSAGYIMTKHGMVGVYRQGSSKYAAYTSLELVHNGRCFIRTFRETLSDRQVSLRARRFAREIAGELVRVTFSSDPLVALAS